MNAVTIRLRQDYGVTGGEHKEWEGFGERGFASYEEDMAPLASAVAESQVAQGLQM